ncbi:hypothetical protein [Streptomyces sp. Wb2n-11]|uniref:hypothetical protein n=1 Tax=Streptomyces sp. Wb2n-11 TaxID=1030533 RepID=UPI000A96F148|nr:hypothetical protein [Streptomyces sp. Wb2n-11]
MFEIRIICTEPEASQITNALSQTFTTGNARRYPSPAGSKVRLYITAEQRPGTAPWPTPELAYKSAPSIISEIGWTAERASEAISPIGLADVREFWLRKAAVLDRIALCEADEVEPNDAAEAATEAGRRVLVIDNALVLGPSASNSDPYGPGHPESIANPRGYVRQEYARWAKHQ